MEECFLCHEEGLRIVILHSHDFMYGWRKEEVCLCEKCFNKYKKNIKEEDIIK